MTLPAEPVTPEGWRGQVLYTDPGMRQLVLMVARERYGAGDVEYLTALGRVDGVPVKPYRMTMDTVAGPDAELRIPESVARLLHQLLDAHYGVPAARELRNDYEHLRARHDGLVDTLGGLATGLVRKPQITVYGVPRLQDGSIPPEGLITGGADTPPFDESTAQRVRDVVERHRGEDGDADGRVRG